MRADFGSQQIWRHLPCTRGFPGGSADKESACNAGDLGSIPGLGRSPGEGKVYPLRYSGLENSMDCVVHGVTKGRTRLSDFHFQWSIYCLFHYKHTPHKKARFVIIGGFLKTFIFVCAESLVLCVGFLWLRWAEPPLWLWWAGPPLWLWCTSFSFWWLLFLQTRAPELRSTAVAGGLSCPHRMWDLPAARIEPASLALQGGVLATGPARKPLSADDSTLVLHVLMIAYSAWYWIRDLWRTRFSFGTRDQAWPLKGSCVAEVLSQWKRSEKASDRDIRRKTERAPSLI